MTHLASLLILSLLSAVAGPDVEVHTSDQTSLRGVLSAWEPDAIVIQSAGTDHRLPLKSLLSVSLTAPTVSLEKYSALVELTDGSALAATDIQIKGGTAKVTLVGGGQLSLPTRAIRSVRFQSSGDHDEETGKQWAEILASKPAGDLLVVRKKGELDYLEGVLGDLDGEGLKFELDKETSNVKRIKIEGMIFYHAAGEPLPDALCEMTFAGGTRLAAQKVALADGLLKITTFSGAEIEMKLQQARQFDFSGGTIRYLSDLEPEVAETAAFFPLRQPLAVLTDFTRFRRDIGPEQSPLKLDGKSYRKGLSLQSRTTLAYRLPGQFNRFQAVVGIDDSVREAGNALLEIKGDGKSLWQGALRGTEPGQTIDVAVSGVRRLEIVVDFGEDLDIADHVNLCDAKVSK